MSISEHTQGSIKAPGATSVLNDGPAEHPATTVAQLMEEMGHDRFTNRELSWLDFGARLLDLGEDPNVPLLERVKFFAIFSEGLDEFFQVRVAGLKDQVDAGLRARSADGLRPGDALREIATSVRKLIERQVAGLRSRDRPGAR